MQLLGTEQPVLVSIFFPTQLAGHVKRWLGFPGDEP